MGVRIFRSVECGVGSHAVYYRVLHWGIRSVSNTCLSANSDTSKLVLCRVIPHIGTNILEEPVVAMLDRLLIFREIDDVLVMSVAPRKWYLSPGQNIKSDNDLTT